MSFDLTPIDPDSIPDVPSDTTPNTETPKKRRGRPAGSTGRRASVADRKNVEVALATMSTLYSSASAAFLMAGKPSTAEMVASRIEQTQAANRQAFEASPKLASTIAKLGQVSSVALFIGSNLTLSGMVLTTLRMESAMQRQERAGQA